MDEEREIALYDENDMETDKVDATSHNRETVKNALERKLSNRAAKQELMDKNILHGYTTSPALHGPMSSLERRKKNDELQKKIRQRPDQDELVQMNILKNTSSVHSSLQANQTQLKRAVTANSLSQKIASRPGPLSLIQKGILDPTNNCLVGAVKQLPLPVGEELEEGGMAAVPLASQQVLQQKKRQQQRHSVATMGGSGLTNQSSQVSSQTTSPFHSGEWNKLTSPISRSMSADVVEDGHEERLRKGSSSSSIPSPPEFLNLESPAHSPSGSVGVRSPPTSLRNFQAGRNMNKIPTVSPKLCKKQIKSKREKFRFHIYQPPNQKRGMKDLPQKQRSPYSLLVQQQQILLQLQVLQQQHPEMMNTGINFPPIPSDCSPQQHMQILLQTLHKMTENRSNISSSIPTSKSSPPFSSESIAQKDNSPLSMMANSQQQHHKMSTGSSFTNESLIQCDNGKKVKFEDVRVNNLKEACKEKKLVVSGKKAELVERLLEHNNGALPASVMERKDIGPDGRTTTPQELPSGIPTTSPTIFKFPSNQVDNVTAPIRTNYMHIKKIQDKFDEDNQKKKLNYISGNNYSGPIAPMPDMVPARYTVQQHQKLANQAAMSTAVGINSTVVNNSLSHMYTGESHQPLIKKKSLSEPSSPILSPSSPLSLLTRMIGGDHSGLLDSSTSQQQQLDGGGAAKQQFTAHQQQSCNGVAGMFNSGSNSSLMTNDDEILFRTKATAPPPNHRKSMPVLPPYINSTGPPFKQQSTVPPGAANAGDYQYSDGSDLYDADGLPVVDPSEQLMDIGTDPSLMGILDVNGEGYQNNVPQNNKVVADSNPLDFLSMNNPFVIGRSGVDLPSPKDVPPPPPYTSNSHPTANPDLSWMTNYGASPVHTSMAFLSQSLSTTGSVAAERYHNSEHTKSNLNSIQPFLDSDLPVPNLDLFSSADTEKYLSMSM